MHYEVTAKSVPDANFLTVDLKPEYDIECKDDELWRVPHCANTSIPLVFDTLWRVAPRNDFVYRIFLADLRALPFPDVLQELVYAFYASGEGVGEKIGNTKHLHIDRLAPRFQYLFQLILSKIQCVKLNALTGALVHVQKRLHADIPPIPSHNWDPKHYSWNMVNSSCEIEFVSPNPSLSGKKVPFGAQRYEDVIVHYDESLGRLLKLCHKHIPIQLSYDLCTIRIPGFDSK
jgi:hypothetical protein